MRICEKCHRPQDHGHNKLAVFKVKLLGSYDLLLCEACIREVASEMDLVMKDKFDIIVRRNQ